MRLERNRQEAQVCRPAPAGWPSRGLAATLVDVEQLFGWPPAVFLFSRRAAAGNRKTLTEQLAEVYDAAAQISRFAATLTEGCGPGCGTSEAEGGGCGSGADGPRAVAASACGTKKRVSKS